MKTISFAPIITTEAGSCLTAENWQEVGVDTLVYTVESLLIKPGQDFLKKIPNLKHYLGCSGRLIIDAHNLQAKDSSYKVVSSFDGSKIHITQPELVTLLVQLQPDAVLLPKSLIQEFPDIWTVWPNNIAIFLHEEDHQHLATTTTHGVYFDTKESSNYNDQLSKWFHLPRYVTGNLQLQKIKELQALGINYIASNEPAALALFGIVYTQSNQIDLKEIATATQFERIDANCACPTCRQNLTKAYLHHLYFHTPLLCQRFLIQHNLWQLRNYM